MPYRNCRSEKDGIFDLANQSQAQPNRKRNMDRLDPFFAEVEAWLSETNHRTMYSQTEVRDRLLELRIKLTEVREHNANEMVREGV